MSLLFEKIYLPNQLEMVIELSKKYKIETTIDKELEMKFQRIDGDKLIDVGLVIVGAGGILIKKRVKMSLKDSTPKERIELGF
tara:strand:- start:374 stop:622 length:249 start_codon:yes stop_codon:yes gene_type:complete